MPIEVYTVAWNTTVEIVKEKGLFCGIKYISSLKASPKTNNSIYKHVLRVLYSGRSLIDSVLSNNKNCQKVSEQDVLDIWCPIFKHLIKIKDTIRLKKGETVNSSSTEQKKLLYPNNQSIIGFKIDFRLLLDYDNNEIGLASGEVAINSFDEDKVVRDESKLLREAKDITDRHISFYLNNNFGWSIQICGLEGSVQTAHLDRTGLYISIPQFEIAFPKEILDLYRFTDTLASLYNMIVNLEKQAQYVIGYFKNVNLSRTKKLSDIRQTPESSSNPIQSFCYKQRPTYYTPPSQDRTISVIPRGLFEIPNGKRKYPAQDELFVGETNAVNDKDKRQRADQYGWLQLENGTWKNVLSGEVSDEKPY